MEALLAILVISVLAALPIIASIAAASVAISTLRENGVTTNRWMVLPFVLMAFAFICYAVSLWALSYTPATKPGLLNPILGVLLFDSVCLLPFVALASIRAFAVMRLATVEASLHFCAVLLYALLYFPYVALHEYYPRV